MTSLCSQLELLRWANAVVGWHEQTTRVVPAMRRMSLLDKHESAKKEEALKEA